MLSTRSITNYLAVMYMLVLFLLLICSIGISKASREAKCLFMASSGPCHGNLQMFAYDFDNNCCVKFLYGGCGGNPNRFQTKQECIVACNALQDPEDEDITSTNSYTFTEEQLKPDAESTQLIATSLEVEETVSAENEEVTSTSTLKITLKKMPEAFTLFNFHQFN
ncbi:hypothetical protein M5D96_002760 [Drosophila gunungcola]|uniref:BPTI/Kunitz inhibitor domain-containing protein n=1 Tax=Drosophila gunungcola TaxID=103775 RepID=A0A9Q0BWR3_9MUSC|nr:hypothetical protein M5D96_002760 [Drosophila gunungcola]